AAHRQGKFKEMNDKLWEKGYGNHQMDMSDMPAAEGGGQPQKCWDTADGCKFTVSFAQELQIDVGKFKNDMKDCQGFVQKDMKDLSQLMVQATSAFFINGRYISGAV